MLSAPDCEGPSKASKRDDRCMQTRCTASWYLIGVIHFQKPRCRRYFVLMRQPRLNMFGGQIEQDRGIGCWIRGKIVVVCDPIACTYLRLGDRQHTEPDT